VSIIPASSTSEPAAANSSEQATKQCGTNQLNSDDDSTSTKPLFPTQSDSEDDDLERDQARYADIQNPRLLQTLNNHVYVEKILARRAEAFPRLIFDPGIPDTILRQYLAQ
jgi:hypothetical protein